MSGPGEGAGPAPRVQWLAAAVAGVVFAVVEVRAAWLRYLVNDDYQMLYTGWLRSTGKVAPADFAIQSFHVLPDLLAIGYRLLGPTLSVLWTARVAMVGVMLLAALGAAVVAHRAVSPRAAPFAFTYALLTWGTLVRGGDVRPDVISAALALAIAALAARPADVRRAFALGLLLAVTFVVRFKGLVILPVAAAALALAAWRARPAIVSTAVRLGGAAAAGAAAVLAPFALFLVATRQVEAFFAGTRVVSGLAARFTGQEAAAARAATLDLAWSHDAWFIALVAAGALVLARGARDRRLEQHVTLGGLAFACVVLVYGNSAFYAYCLAAVAPMLAPIAAAAPAALVHRLGGRPALGAAVAAAAVLLPIVWHGPLLAELALRRTNAHQLALQRLVDATPPDTVVFALEGLGLFRPSLRDWRLASISRPLYQQGEIDLASQLEASRPDLVVTNYRLPAWLSREDARRTFRWTVPVSPFLRVIGAASRAGAPATLELRRPRAFVAAGRCAVDGSPAADGATVTIGAGRHEVTGDCVLRLDLPYRELRDVLASGQQPYLLHPASSVYEGR